MRSLSPGRTKNRLRKQALLFALCVLVPALVLLFFTIRMNRQGNELRERRAGEIRQLKAAEFGQAMADSLSSTERVVMLEVAQDPDEYRLVNRTFSDLIFVGRISDGVLLMPWVEVPNSESLSEQAGIEDLILQAQKAEFSKNDLDRAGSLLDRALSSDLPSSLRSQIQLHLGRVRTKSGEKEEARHLYEEILAQPGDLTDEYGIPFSFFAAERLLALEGDVMPVLGRLESVLENFRWLPSEALYLVRDITAQLQERALDLSEKETVGRMTRSLEAALSDNKSLKSLQAYVAGWLLRLDSSGIAGGHLSWEAYGNLGWIVGIREHSEGRSQLVFVFDGPSILNTAIQAEGLVGTFPGSVRMTADPEEEGISPGRQFRGFRLLFEEMDVSAWSRSTLPFPILYWLILVLVVGITAFGGYLLWRDVSRELAMAEMKSHFAASVSHELKTPLTAIRMLAEALTMGVRQQPEQQHEYLHTIISESERLSRLLNNVLDFSKIEQGTRSYRFEPTSLDEVILAAERTMSFPMEQNGFHLMVESDKSVPLISADKDAMEQAVLNLLHNAMKYSGESREIRLELRMENEAARIDVIDHGIGISEEDRDHVFGRFFRVHGSENKKVPGTGIGLTIVSHIARAHQGTVELESRPGEGSTFSIILPLEVP